MMHSVQYLKINDEASGQRLDNFLIRTLKGVPKSHVYRIIRSGEVRVNQKRSQAATRLMACDNVRIPPIRDSTTKVIVVKEALQKRLHAAILYEDSELLVLNKPSGIAVHGGSGISLGIIEALRKTRVDLIYLELVHRLDRETSGCLLLAKKRNMLRQIQALLAERKVKKTYWACVDKVWRGPRTVVVDQPLKKNHLQSGERIVVINPQGKEAQTQFRLLENYTQNCLVEVYPKTGRTHQIRVHSAHIGHPILGDHKYGQMDEGRLYLHARQIQFTLNGKDYKFAAEVDAQFSEKLRCLKGI